MTFYECRRFSRYESETPVELSRNDGETQTGKTIDVSAVGLRLHGKFDVNLGEKVQLVLTPADPGIDDIQGEAEVIACNGESLSLDFSSMSQKDFENLCEHLQAINVTEPAKVEYEIASNLHLLHFLEN